MAYEMLVGLNVVDDERYSAYRRGMTPILERYGGSFRFDFTVQKTLKSAVSHPINRVFIISFPNEKWKDDFFKDPDYQKVKKEFYLEAVKDTAILTESLP
jgi:uncharacterized protein (DUF1330 family)